MKIFLVIGGTGGSSVPALAVAEELNRKKQPELFFIGEGKSLEKHLLRDVDFPFTHLSVPAGKWRRYFSPKNFTDLILVFLGFLKSLYLISEHNPDVIFGAGSYVQVPVVWAGYFMRVPVVVHQQDFHILLSTRLAAPIARKITVAFEYAGKQFPRGAGLLRKLPRSKVVHTGNPVRSVILKGDKKRGRERFSLSDKYPTVFVTGGGKGATWLNALVVKTAPELVKYVQVLHLTGESKKSPTFDHERFRQYEFLGREMADAYAVSDLVLSRAGMSTIAELAVLGKPAILVPLPDSPQILNAGVLGWYNCALVVEERFLNEKLLIQLVRKILWDRAIQETMTYNIRRVLPNNAAAKVSEIIMKAVKT